MKQFKWLLSGFLAITMLMSFAACSGREVVDSNVVNFVAEQAIELESSGVQPMALGMSNIDPTVEYCSASVVSAASVSGDINGDGRVSIADIVLLNAHAKGKITLKDEVLQKNDINGDGKIDTYDVKALQGDTLGHTIVVDKGVAPTCTRNGVSDGQHCSMCNKVLVAQMVVKATGHTYVNGACHCGATNSIKPQFVMASKTAKRGETVEITVALKNNPGIASIALDVAYDSNVLTLNNIVYNMEMGGVPQLPQTMGSPTRLLWINGYANSHGDFVLATLSFTVKNNATLGDHSITMTYDPDNVYDISETNLPFEVVNGKVTVTQ